MRTLSAEQAQAGSEGTWPPDLPPPHQLGSPERASPLSAPQSPLRMDRHPKLGDTEDQVRPDDEVHEGVGAREGPGHVPTPGSEHGADGVGDRHVSSGASQPCLPRPQLHMVPQV